MKTQGLRILRLVLCAISLASASWASGPRTERVYLTGKGALDPVDWEFFCSSGMNSGNWTTIGVPSCWELKGFGHYNYGKDKFEERVNEHGLYKHSFNVPEDWKGREVTIVFEGVMTDAAVKINGHSAGPKHQGAFYEFKYSITDKLRFGGDNLLEVRVDKASSNESINHAEREADFWIFGGIFRPVYVEVLPREHIKRVAVDAQATGAIKADIFVDAPSAENLKLTLKDQNGNKVQDLAITDVENASGKWSVSTEADTINTWNAEQPNLYVLQIDLLAHDGKELHTIEQRIGFRTVEVREGDGIYVNGQRIKFKGVNRHSFRPQSGRTTTPELSIEHVRMMKDMNMNAVRMSHYPPDVHFLEACDEYGLFVIDEVCTWHSPHLDTEVGRKIVKETVVRDVNHPSILLWANGNETGWNTELDDDYPIWDIQKREVIHPWNIFRKTNTLHYFHYHGLANDAPKNDKIFFPTEFLHGLYDGGLGAGLEDYWNLMWEMPLSAGGFLWVFADEGVVRTDKNNIIDFDGNHAPDGIVGPHGEKEASYFTIKDIWSPIHIEKRFIRDGFNGVFRVENRYHFTDLDACTMTARWVKYGAPDSSKTLQTVSEEIVRLPSLGPGATGTFEVALPGGWQTIDALHLTAADPHGQDILTWTYPVKSPQKLNRDFVKTEGEGSPKAETKGNEIHVSASKVNYVFCNEKGILKSVSKNGNVIPLDNGPIILGHKDKMESVVVEEKGNKVTITATYEESDKHKEWVTHAEFSADVIKWTIQSNGLLDLHVEFKNHKRVKDYKGISFSFPEAEVAGMKWLGDGPYRVWRNRMRGTQFKVWENDYNNSVTGESGFVYPEFKGFFSSLYWATVKGRNDNGFTVYCHSPRIFLRMLTPQNPAIDPNKRVTVEFPQGDISFLNNIPGIGTKFNKAEASGPSGNPENYFGNDDEPIVIDLTFEF